MDIAAAAGQNETPEPVVQQQLLDQLSKVAAVVELSPDELLAELQALQLDALYDTHVDTAADGQATGTGELEPLLRAQRELSSLVVGAHRHICLRNA
jgi:hypothetical protein